MRESDRPSLLDAETRDPARKPPLIRARERAPGLTILYHPDLARIGAEARLFARKSSSTALSRTTPDFVQPGKTEGWPLADPFLSRRPLQLRRGEAGSILLLPDAEAGPQLAGGIVLDRERRISREELEQGVVLELGHRVVLCLGLLAANGEAEGEDERAPERSLIGETEPMRALRSAIARVAELPVTVLLRGETGTGKELVARAIHEASPRRAQPFVAVNIGAIAPSVATSALFGHVKGAFTGASEDHAGYFERAGGGTLFLDEIGEAPEEVQVMLLRVLESGAIQRVGGSGESQVDVRLIAATDRDLDRAVKSDRFRAALLHRLAGYELHLPALRERRADFGRLLLRFLREELERLGHADKLATPSGDEPWIPAPLVALLARYDWPGNVRELRNVVRQMIISNLDAPVVALDRSLERLLALAPPLAPAPAPEPEREPEPSPRRRPSEVGEAELIAALREHRFRLEPAAEALQISRTSLYALIDASETLRKAKDVPLEELERAERELGGDVEAMAERLEVSARGLRLRLGALHRRT